MAPSPCSHSGGSRKPAPSPDCDGPPAASPLLVPVLRGATCASGPRGSRTAQTPAPQQSPSPYSRCLSGGCHSAVTCPGPRQGSADQLITLGRAGRSEGGAHAAGARGERPRPFLWRALSPRPRPPAGPAHQPGAPPLPSGTREAGGGSTFPPQQALPLSLQPVKGWRPCRGASFLFIFLTVPQREKRGALPAERAVTRRAALQGGSGL